VTRGLVEVAIDDDVRRLAAGESWSRASEDDELAAAEPTERRRRAKRAHRRAQRPEPAAEPEPTAPEDFEAAVALRRDGSPAEAARAFAAFLADHSDDARAPLAAFELGRLRMDALGDRSGAITALERAVRTTASAPFRQDALARLVRLYDDLGRTAQCTRARDQYLTAHPTGPHAADVRARCDSDD
jgi:TolA-binding protein